MTRSVYERIHTQISVAYTHENIEYTSQMLPFNHLHAKQNTRWSVSLNVQGHQKVGIYTSCLSNPIQSNPIQSTFIPDNKVHNTYYSYSNKSKEK